MKEEYCEELGYMYVCAIRTISLDSEELERALDQAIEEAEEC